MGFQPIVPFSGLAGWAFLQRTQNAQQKAFESGAEIQRDTAYFAENIGKISTAGELVEDYRLLKVALGAFGLENDLPNKAFVLKVLEGGTLDPESFANRMVDKRYFALADAFGFDLGTPRTKLSDIASGLLENYRTRQFEVAVGETDNNMRLALSLDRELTAIVSRDNSADGRWFSVMGNEPLRKVFETALGLPASVGALDIDRQLTVFRDRASAVLGNGEVDQFSNPDARERLNQLFLMRAQIAEGGLGISSGSIALRLLQES
ncbi:DUF1217 domain-containing protein [Sinisalibacter lacisalsi]|uniref:Flagellar basal body rod protein FlgF n=1 Tax=Sinisalibacter lacisalsi TaxID=1526570 RepID=A0ABQ1QDP4_9RHOB|nr:DUF1217 domain-containing protein [Sinisalibacter lacisalsi]GGD22922.1 flagellar basal body rod protein FlgF [Sinisalibacter lacisalsi]